MLTHKSYSPMLNSFEIGKQTVNIYQHPWQRWHAKTVYVSLAYTSSRQCHLSTWRSLSIPFNRSLTNLGSLIGWCASWSRKASWATKNICIVSHLQFLVRCRRIWQIFLPVSFSLYFHILELHNCCYLIGWPSETSTSNSRTSQATEMPHKYNVYNILRGKHISQNLKYSYASRARSALRILLRVLNETSWLFPLAFRSPEWIESWDYCFRGPCRQAYCI